MLQSAQFKQKHLKILYFITKSQVGGGAQTHVSQLARFMIEQGHEVAVCSQPDGWLSARAKKIGASFFPNVHIDNTLNPLRLSRAGKRLRAVVREFEPDVISCHSTIAGLVGRLCLRGMVPTVFTAHGWGFAPGIPEPRRSAVAALERLAARWAARIICVSDYDRKLALNRGVGTPVTLMTIHNGVEEISSVETNPSHNNPHSNVQALFVGRLVNQKDPFTLVRAISALPQTLQDNFHLTIVGDGPLATPLQHELKNLNLQDRVKIVDRMERSDLFALYHRMDLFVLTSHWEGLPRSILEAMAHGLPIIATDVGGSAEAVGEDAGLLVPEENVSALVQALRTLIQDKELREKMGQAGHQKTLNEFSLAYMCAQTMQVYKQIL